MLLTISTTHQPATDLGFLLHKHPDKLQEVELSVGKAHIFYPEATEQKTTICVLLDIDTIELVRGGRQWGKGRFALGQYVNDRPYVLSSFMSVVLSKAFSTAMNGRCNQRPELVDVAMPLTAELAMIPAPKGGEKLIRSFFEPLGYDVDVQRHTLDEKFPEWGNSAYYTVRISGTTTVKDLLKHLYVLMPALDAEKHYFINQDEVNVLVAKGEGWLQQHPERDVIARRFLFNLRGLANQAIGRLSEGDDAEVLEEIPNDEPTTAVYESLHTRRLQSVVDELVIADVHSIADLGCGEGKLLRLLLKNGTFTTIIGMDVSYESLVRAKESLHWEHMATRMKDRIQLIHGSLTYTDSRLHDVEAAALVEVIEHLDEDRLEALENNVFGYMSPRLVVVTTPNSEYNAVYTGMPSDTFRHSDHRFEWTREQFTAWCERIKERFGYDHVVKSIGDVHVEYGAPSQMGVFHRGA